MQLVARGNLFTNELKKSNNKRDIVRLVKMLPLFRLFLPNLSTKTYIITKLLKKAKLYGTANLKI